MSIQTVKEKLISVLETFKYPVFLQGSLAEDEAYPTNFFTFWNNSSEDANHYDNNAVNYEWDFDVNFYSTSPQTVETTLLEAKAALKAAGFIVGGKGHDVASDEKTHTGRGLDVLYLE